MGVGWLIHRAYRAQARCLCNNASQTLNSLPHHCRLLAESRLPQTSNKKYGETASKTARKSSCRYPKTICFITCDRGRVSARQPRYFLLLRQKISTQRKGAPTVRVPTLRFTSLRASLRHAIQTAVPPNSLRGFAALPLRSDKRRQVRARSNAVLRQRCPQPEQRAAGADTRGNAGAGGLPDL